MRLICPSCGACASADVWQQDATIRQCIQMVAEMPSYVSRHVLAYLGCFRPVGSAQGLKWPKAHRLLSELKAMVEQSHISWDKKPARPNDARFWAQAIEAILERANQGRLKLPLDNHNYLRAIAYDLADQADRAGETARNQALVAGNHPRTPIPNPQSPILNGVIERTPEEIEEAQLNFAKLNEILGNFGRMPDSGHCPKKKAVETPP